MGAREAFHRSAGSIFGQDGASCRCRPDRRTLPVIGRHALKFDRPRWQRLPLVSGISPPREDMGHVCHVDQSVLATIWILLHQQPMTSVQKATQAPRPTISLVIPAYNEQDYLPACLDAVVRNLGGQAMEIIVVDNNSTDGTRQVVERYPGVTYVFEPRKGITRARQRGYQAASGDIIAYIDADTRPRAGWIEQIWQQFGANPDLACLSGPYSFYDLSGIRNMITSGWFVLAQPLYKITGYMLVGGNFAIRSDVLDKMGGFDSSIEFYGEDVDIAKRARRHGKVLFSTRFVMPTSGRRMTKQGFAKMAGLYFTNYIWIMLRGKPAHTSYEDVR
jgi:glycosyltransferase involved in cell wall biosynthesis